MAWASLFVMWVLGGTYESDRVKFHAFFYYHLRINPLST